VWDGEFIAVGADATVWRPQTVPLRETPGDRRPLYSRPRQSLRGSFDVARSGNITAKLRCSLKAIFRLGIQIADA